MNRENSTPWNVIVVVADTVRPQFLGCYGNEWMQTPCIDQFAQESTRFTRAHPECLPTIPTRRTLHSGRLDHYMRQNTTDALGRPEFAKA